MGSTKQSKIKNLLNKAKSNNLHKSITLIAVIVCGLLGTISLMVHISNHRSPYSSSTKTSPSTPSKTLLQEAYEKAVSSAGMSPSQTKIEHTDGGMIQISNDGKVIALRMPSETEAHTKDWMRMLARVIINLNGANHSDEIIQKLQDISLNHILDYQEVEGTDGSISEFVGQIEITDKISAVIGIPTDDRPFSYFAFYEKSNDLFSVTHDVCSAFYTRSISPYSSGVKVQFFLQDAIERQYTDEINKKMFTISEGSLSLSSGGASLTMVGYGGYDALHDNLTSCVFTTLGVPQDVLEAMTTDRNNYKKSGAYTWDDYEIDTKISTTDKSYTQYYNGPIPYYIFSRKSNNSASTQQKKASVTPIGHGDATTSPIMRDGVISTQITIPVSCAWNTNDYTVNSSGYLRKSDGSSTRTDTTMLSDNKYAKYGAVTCETETVKVRYDLPEGYTYHPNLGGAYRASNDEEKHELSIHVKMSIFANQKEGFYSSSDIDGYQFNIYDSNNNKVESYFIKLTPKFDSDQYNFLRNWEVRID